MSTFSISKKQQESVHILQLHGELDAHTAPDLEQEILKLMDSKCYNIVVNFSTLDYISSAGLGVFMAYIEELRDLGGDIKLTDMKPSVYNVFDLLGFPTLYDIVDAEQQAVAKFINTE
ncbi:MAG: STAS domain-containing protein [Balneolales bacterium]|nr:STAS domain-containing protein [Balneolales bacterium]